eukprot:2636346-Rhodomonas_salina.1
MVHALHRIALTLASYPALQTGSRNAKGRAAGCRSPPGSVSVLRGAYGRAGAAQRLAADLHQHERCVGCSGRLLWAVVCVVVMVDVAMGLVVVVVVVVVVKEVVV